MSTSLSRFVCCLIAVGGFAFSSAARAEVRLPQFFGDHMVLQRQAPIPIWGWANPGEAVSVRLGPDAIAPVETTADEQGHWHVELPAREASEGPLTLTVTGPANQVVLQDILVGEVWLCSGQSNMEWTVGASLDPDVEAAAAVFPQIRHMKIEHLTSGTPQDDVPATWLVCSPETVRGFTAAGYFMARELHRELGVPIGLLNISWGGTRIEPWTPIEGFADVEGVTDIFERVARTLPGDPRYQSTLENHVEATAAWLESAKEALESKSPLQPSPSYPKELLPLVAHTDPTAIYNAMMSPVVGYGMRGAIWYQGESNHSEGMAYLDKKKALLAGWRKLWGIGEFPFYFVQIAPYQYGNEDPHILPQFWEAQSACLEIPGTGMVVTNDIGNLSDIHPKNKQEVGRRLALLALEHTYGRTDVVSSSPILDSMTIDGSNLRLKFGNAAGGLRSRDGKPLDHFEIIGEQAAFVPANAVIEGEDTLVLSSPEVQEPAAMRFAWDKSAEPNLVNGAGLPAAAFRAGEIPDYDFLALKVVEAADFELVYDLDLRKLGPEIPYDRDRTAEITGAFDRVGYFIELVSGGKHLWAWVSMDAFTESASALGIPTAASGAVFQQEVKNLRVLGNVEGLNLGEGLAGNLEFWPHNYGPTNAAKVAGASDTVWDYGDERVDPVAGYGCMQVHQTAAGQTIFAINHWIAAQGADLGIGNSSGQTRDWTFSGNAGQFESARLRVLVRMRKD